MLRTTKLKLAREDNEESKQRTAKLLNKTLASFIILTAVATLMFRLISLNHLDMSGPFANPAGDYFIYANLMHTTLFAEAILVLIRLTQQKYLYFPYLSRKKQKTLDEREMNIRRKTFERSYSLVFVGLIYTLWSSTYKSFTVEKPQFLGDELNFVVWAILLIIVSLPSVLATYDKNS